MTRALKDMILQALDDAGGQQYLAEQATKNPAAFLTLHGRVLPLTLAGDASEPLTVCVTNYSSGTSGHSRGDPTAATVGASSQWTHRWREMEFEPSVPRQIRSRFESSPPPMTV